ncbi:MAG: hypothetical protein O7F71_12485 [Gammaproteobacteria bacterium]|nr:hypothetical protein [Gammaproteobacteria bacterium]
MLKIFLYGIVLAALAWRVLALEYPHPAIDDPQIVNRWLAVMGLWFVACGAWAFHRHPNRSTALLLIYGVCTGIHWGGAVGFDEQPHYTSLGLYLVISSITAQCLFLNLAILGSTAHRLGLTSYLVVYAPVLGGLILITLQAAFPADQQILSYLFVGLSVASVFSVIGAGFWISGWLRAPKGSRIRFRRGLVVAALLGWIPSILVMFDMTRWELAGLLNLTLAFEAAALAWFFTHVVDEAARPNHRSGEAA